MTTAETNAATQKFTYFPETEKQVSDLPQLVKQLFAAHIVFIRESHRLWTEKVKIVYLDNTRYDVTRSQQTFSFYCQSEDARERKTVSLTMDGGFGRIERVGIICQSPLPDQAGTTQTIHTDISLTRGVHVEQEVSPIPANMPSRYDIKQLFIFDTNRLELATLSWIIGEQEQPIVTFTKAEEIIHVSTRSSLITGGRVLQVPGGFVYLPHPDELISQAIRNVVNQKPVELQFSRV